MRDIIRRLECGERCWPAEIALRTLGLALLGLSAASAFWLSRLANQSPLHSVRPIEILAALLTFLGCSSGSAFLFEGSLLFELVPVPERYRHFS